jgi:hypothetical protein
MTVYQVINKQNELRYAYLSYEIAVKEVKKLSRRDKESYVINAVVCEGF